MDTELAEVRDFLAAHAPFDTLPEAVLARLPQRLSVRYFRRGTQIIAHGAPNHALYTVRSGAVELRSASGVLEAQLGEGELFGYLSLLSDYREKTTATALEDTLLFILPDASFQELRGRHDAFAHFFAPFSAEARTRRLQPALSDLHTASSGVPLSVRVADLVLRPAVMVPPRTTVQEAAQRMYQELISSVVVGEARLEGTLLEGIVTDRDLRGRVVAQGLPYDTPVSHIMTPAPRTISKDAYAFEALLEMTRHNLHHLPVMDGERLLGLVSSTDLMRLQTANPIYLVGDIAKQTTVAGLVAISQRLPRTVRHLVEADATASEIARLVTTVGDALETRLLELAEKTLGPPPAAYAWLVLGSQARFERSAHSDQDNALLLGDDAAPEHDRYFERLAHLVSDGLHACGYPYCPGEVMATNPTWRQPLRVWKGYFHRWIDAPEPRALLHSSIFFDLRALHGEVGLFESLQRDVLARTPRDQRFLAQLAKNALEHTPPLGFFRQFVLSGSGEHAHTFDLKHKGVVPIIDLARVYALQAGRSEVGTSARLEACAQAGVLSQEGALNLRDVLEFISYVRLRHQGRQVRAGALPDNFVSPEELSPFERRHLKDAFATVREMQSVLEGRFQTRFLG